MKQYSPNNNDIDFTRLMYKNNNDNNPFKSNGPPLRFENDIEIMNFNRNEGNLTSEDLLPKNNNNIKTIDTFNNSMKKMKELTDDLFEKNKNLQEYKNKLYKYEQENESLKQENQKLKLNNSEIVNITQKNRELMNDINKNMLESKNDKIIIEKLSKTINELEKALKMKINENETLIKEKLQKNAKGDNNNDNDDKKIIYENKELRKILKKHKKMNDTQISDLFTKYKLTEDFEITKDLLLRLL